ncbi:MAG TPA: hypothetical protein VFL91_00680 [Thermomicrobiales bacterium]|nr:hypothetical protein [Thermomicrobiales bacterium]
MTAIPGDVLLVPGDPAKRIDQLVMRDTGSRFVHAALVFARPLPPASPAPLVIEAVWPRVRLAADAYAGAVVVAPPYPDEAARHRAVTYALGRVGDRYDGLGLALQAAYRWPPTRRPARRALDRWTRLPLFWCSELVCRALREAGLAPPCAADVCSPGDLARWLGVA